MPLMTRVRSNIPDQGNLGLRSPRMVASFVLLLLVRTFEHIVTVAHSRGGCPYVVCQAARAASELWGW